VGLKTLSDLRRRTTLMPSSRLLKNYS
jgi:hypothetical protein